MKNENEPIRHRYIQEFKTSDMPLATFLRYSGYKCTEVRKVDDRRAEFVFDKVDKQDLDDFNSDKTCVEPKMYTAIMRQQNRAARRVVQQ